MSGALVTWIKLNSPSDKPIWVRAEAIHLVMHHPDNPALTMVSTGSANPQQALTIKGKPPGELIEELKLIEQGKRY